jgi:hypothetical protein
MPVHGVGKRRRRLTPPPVTAASVHAAMAPVTCVYRLYEGELLVATGRLTLDDLPNVGDELQLNGRRHRVRAVEYGGGENVVTLEAR